MVTPGKNFTKPPTPSKRKVVTGVAECGIIPRMIELFLTDKELAAAFKVSQATISRIASRDGGFRGVRPVIVGKSRRWPRREIERAAGLAQLDGQGERRGEAHDEPKVVGRWRTAKKRPNRWGEAVQVYGLGGAAVG